MTPARIGEAAKAVYAAVLGALGALTTVLVGPSTFSGVTDGQWVAVVTVGLVSGGGVYGIRNARCGTGASGPE